MTSSLNDEDSDLYDRAHLHNADELEVMFREKPRDADFFDGLPDGDYLPTEAEKRDPVLLFRYIVFLSLSRSRTLESLRAALDRYFPWLTVNARQIARNSTEHDWIRRAAAWDSLVGQAVFPRMYASQLDAISAAQARHIEDSRDLAQLVRGDLRLLLKWDMNGRKDERPATYFPSVVLPSAMKTAQDMERRARGMDIRDQVAMGALVPGKQHAALAEQLEKALLAIPDEAIRESIRKETGLRLLEAEGGKR